MTIGELKDLLNNSRGMDDKELLIRVGDDFLPVVHIGILKSFDDGGKHRLFLQTAETMTGQDETHDLTDEQKVDELVQSAVSQLSPMSSEHLAEIRQDFRALVAERRQRLEARNAKEAEEKRTKKR
jgi:hypothetical protein